MPQRPVTNATLVTGRCGMTRGAAEIGVVGVSAYGVDRMVDGRTATTTTTTPTIPRISLVFARRPAGGPFGPLHLPSAGKGVFGRHRIAAGRITRVTLHATRSENARPRRARVRGNARGERANARIPEERSRSKVLRNTRYRIRGRDGNV